MVVWLSGLVCPGNLSQSGAPGSVHMGNSTSRKTSRNYNCDKLYISKHGRAREEKIERCQLCVLYRAFRVVVGELVGWKLDGK